ncbi:MAG: endonuclease I/subtilisin-like proprotein convertase family protein [Phenylobacterium sp.]|jgi:endonuclease I/subtilisin-like proprotein convertase family protein
MKTVSFYKKQFSVIRCVTLTGLSGAFLVNASIAHAGVPAGYYDNANTTTQSALHSSLHEIIDDHTRFPYTSSATDTWDILESADEDPDNSNNVIDIYKNASYAKQGGGNTSYNREHTWPKSYGFPSDGSTNYPYTDTHHLFISDSSYNSSRSNKPYNDCGSGCSEKTTLSNNGRGAGAGDSNWTEGQYENGSWQTWSGRKGDTARAMMYMAVRYEGGTHGVTGVSEPDLILTDDRTLIGSSSQGSNISVAYMGLRSVLLQWHKEDPVDSFEQQHNDTVYLFQGNRNPFVDHPEYASCVFENICNGGSGDTTPPVEPAGLSATGGDGNVALSWSANSDSDLMGYNLYRSNTSGGALSKINNGTLTTTSYSDTNVSSDTTYYYTLKALDTSFNESAASAETSATTDVGVEPPPPSSVTVWINEFHYDNASTDSGEAVEIAGTAGSNLSGWSLVAYNGNGGTTYSTINLSGTIADQQGGMGTLSFTATGLQNGAPDGIALVDSTGTVVQFLSYEGVTTATNGPASGQTSVDVGVSETTNTPVGYSLQLSGSGSEYADFSWTAAATNTFGSANNGQTFNGAPSNQAPTAAFSQNCNALSCSFDASTSTDADGSVTNYSWDFGDGTTGTGVNSSHAYNLDGDYNVVLTITDDGGATDTSSTMVSVAALTSQPWVNEFHYDNDGTDANEAIEVAGAAGTDLSGWSLVAYNGSGGTVYSTLNLSGTIADQQGGYGTLNFAISGLQNGAPDGFALVDNSGTVVQFLSYEGSITATDGPANGTTSTTVPVSETSSTPIGHSLQLSGSGTQYSDFSWQSAAAHTAGSVNNSQTFGSGAPVNQAPVAAFSQNCTALSCTFDASSSADSDGSIVSYDWNFGDSATATGNNPSHTFAADGGYTVVLTVTDNEGATANSSVMVNVADVSTGGSFFENTTTIAIPDRDTITSDIVSDRTGAAGTVDITVDISHTYRGDISLVLQAPDGSQYVLKVKDRSDSAENLNATYTGAISGDAAGTWTLFVSDNIKKDVGQLNGWSVQF